MNEKMQMKLLAHAGKARINAFEAWISAQDGFFEEAQDLLIEAKEEMLLAHGYQADLIKLEALGEPIDKTVFLIHAQDHMMTAMLSVDMVEMLIKTEKKLFILEEKGENE